MSVAAKVLARLPKGPCKVQLHMHMDGAIRASTIYEVAKRRNIPLPQDVRSAQDLSKYVTVQPTCSSLVEFLSTFGFFLPIMQGDREAIERMAYETCLDQEKDGVLYCEARYAPHLLADEHVSAEEVVSIVNKGLQRGMKDTQVTVKSILCCLTHRPDWSEEVVQLAHRFKADGVVGVDLAGDELLPIDGHLPALDLAKKLGLNITIHAGESGPGWHINRAIDRMHAQRIGHGYHVLDDNKVYERALKERIHFECCPTSSSQTNSVDVRKLGWPNHPLRKFVTDNLNCGINTDDPTVCGTTMNAEFKLCVEEMSLSYEDLARCTIRAAQSCFLPQQERDVLVERLCKIWDVPKPAL